MVNVPLWFLMHFTAVHVTSIGEKWVTIAGVVPEFVEPLRVYRETQR